MNTTGLKAYEEIEGFGVDDAQNFLATKWIGNNLVSIEQIAENEFELKWNTGRQEFGETFSTFAEALERGSEIK